MKTLYLDCFAGISGDMFVGAMLDLGLELSALQRELKKLPIDGYRLEARKVNKQGLQATQFKVLLTTDAGEQLADTSNAASHQPHRHLAEILSLIERSALAARVKRDASAVFTRLGQAEAAVHGVPIEQVHFHEVGGVDAIVDIVGAAIALEQCQIERVLCSPLHLGSGMLCMSHGLYPIPAPATAKLIEGFAAYSSEARGELTTPTGAAIATTLGSGVSAMPMLAVQKIGYGAGSKDRDFPNVLRALLADSVSELAPFQQGRALVIEANIDDMNPQHYEVLLAHLLEAGALDATLQPIYMKKQRPGCLLNIVANPDLLRPLLEIVFRESSTIGVRTYEVLRYMLPREMLTLSTRYGNVRVKVARLGNEVVNAMPEYEDCKALAQQAGVSLKQVTAAAIAAADVRFGPLAMNPSPDAQAAEIATYLAH